MQLTRGARLGPYEITDPIGAGGMGEVYRARDTRLDRMVAIKLLSWRLAADSESLQRFEREARAISSLNHPHICSLYDIGDESGAPYLVMEYLEGESLEARLARGAMPVGDALPIAIQIGNALDAAHRRGIVHRDLKPGNIMITGTKSVPSAKLLDFGLAKAAQQTAPAPESLTSLPTTANTITSRGSIVGTFQYMAPEQLEGRDVDARTDLFAFGAVLYEMITGRKAFLGQSQASLISSIMTADPPALSGIQPMAPAALDRTIRKCLAKDPEERWQSARDLVSELKWIGESGSQAGVLTAVTARRRASDKKSWLASALLGAAFIGLVAVTVAHLREAPPQQRTVRFTVSPPDKYTFGTVDLPALSPDGRILAITARKADGGSALFIRSLDAVDFKELPGTADAVLPFWSPDARYIGFFSTGNLKRVEISTGSVLGICNTVNGFGGSWGPGGTILFAGGPEGAILRINEAGGPVAPVTRVDRSQGDARHTFPEFLPDGRHFLFYVLSSKPDVAGIYLGSLDQQGSTTRLAPSETNAQYVEPGYLLTTRAGTLMAQPFDAGRLRFTGQPFPVAEQVRSIPGVYKPVLASAPGVLAYRSGPDTRIQPAWYDRAGKRGASVGAPGDYSNPALSPDGRTLAIGLRDSGTKTRDIWLFDLVRGTSTRFTFDPADDFNPTWSPDGTEIAFASNRKGQRDLYMKPSSGVVPEDPLLQSEFEKNPEDWSADGKYLVFNHRKPGGTVELWAMPLTGDRKPFPVISGPFSAEQAKLSPDSKFIAYRSNEAGHAEIYVQTFPVAGGKWAVSTRGGAEPQWRHDGRELFYLQFDKLMAVDVRIAGTKFEAGVPHELLSVGLGGNARNRYIASPDGQRFLVLSRDDTASSSPVTVVLNWLPSAKR